MRMFNNTHMIIHYNRISLFKVIIKYYLSNFRLDYSINNIWCYILVDKMDDKDF